MTKDEALKLALDALHGFIPYLPLNDGAQCGRYDKAITSIKEALAQQETPNEIGKRVAREGGGLSSLWSAVSHDSDLPEAQRGYEEALAQPEHWEKFCDSNCVWTDHHPDCKLAQRKPLTDEEIYDMYNEPRSDAEMIAFARAIEAAHGIKENT